MAQLGCVDPWRFLFQHSESFSFFSYSRIDIFSIDQNLLPLDKKIEYLTIVESDQVPVLLDLTFPLQQSEYPSWKFDRTLLADEGVCKMIYKKHLTEND